MMYVFGIDLNSPLLNTVLLLGWAALKPFPSLPVRVFPNAKANSFIWFQWFPWPRSLPANVQQQPEDFNKIQQVNIQTGNGWIMSTR